MKKIKIVVFFLINIILLSTINVVASTNTYERSENDYLVPSNITVTEENKWNVLNTPAVDANEKVYDFADLLSDDEESRLYTQINNTINRIDLDLAVVTTDSNPKGSTKVFAEDFYDYNAFDSNGILLVIDMQNREIYMLTTGRAIGEFNDSQVDRVLDAMYPLVGAGNYYGAFYEGIERAESISLYEDAGDESSSYNVLGISIPKYILTVFIISAFITFVVIVIMLAMHKTVRTATLADEYLNNDSVKIVNIADKFMGSHVTKTKIPESNSSSSSGGHTSISRGSSGVSHGGGGRKF